MKTKRPLPKRFSGTICVSGILIGLVAVLLGAASIAMAAPFAYVSKGFSDPGLVFVIDVGAPTAAPVAVRVGSGPGAIAINRAGTRAYVATTDSNSVNNPVSVIHTATVNTPSPVVETITIVGTSPTSVALSADDTKLYVGNSDGTVAIYNTSDNSLVDRIPVDGALSSIAVVGSDVYATTFAGEVVVLDTNTRLPKSVFVSNNLMGIAVNPSNRRVYVASGDTNGDLWVSVIDSLPSPFGRPVNIGPIGTVGLESGFSPGALAISPSGQRVYVTIPNEDAVVAINTANNSLACSLVVDGQETGICAQLVPGAEPLGIAFDPADSTGASVFVVHGSDGRVSAINTTTHAVATPTRGGGFSSVFGTFVTSGPLPVALTLISAPAGAGAFTVDKPAPYPAGTDVTVTATAQAGFQFVSWSSNPSNASCSGAVVSCRVTMNANTTVTATFTPVYALTLASTPTEGGTVAADQPGPYPAGNVVSIRATAKPGFQFVSWSSNPSNATCSGSVDPCKVTMNANTTVTATFTPVYPLTLVSAPTEGGTVAAEQPGPYPAGNIVAVMATAKPGFQFAGWSSNPSNASCSGVATSCTVTMNANTTVTATFTRLYALTLTSTPTGSGSVTADQPGPYPAWQVVTVTAQPNPGFQFTGWSSNPVNATCSGNVVQCKVTMNSVTTVTATFTATPPPPAPTTCDDKINDLEKKVAADKAPWRHNHQLKAALRLYRAAQVELENAKNKVGKNDKRYLRAMSEFNKGKGALCNGHYWHAHHELWESYYIAHEILKQHRR